MQKKKVWLGVLPFFGDDNIYLNSKEKPAALPIRMTAFKTISKIQNQTGTRSCCVVDPALLQVELLVFIVQDVTSLMQKAFETQSRAASIIFT